MFQPFVEFKEDHLKRLMELKRQYLVTQTYNRARDHFSEDLRTAILLTDYEDLGLAKMHENAVKKDKYHATIDLQNETHKQKLNEMMASDSKYRLFLAAVRSTADLQKRIDVSYRHHMKRFITNNTNWRIASDVTLTPGVEMTFGEIFITLKYGRETIRVKFEDIEKS